MDFDKWSKILLKLLLVSFMLVGALVLLLAALQDGEGIAVTLAIFSITLFMGLLFLKYS